MNAAMAVASGELLVIVSSPRPEMLPAGQQAYLRCLVCADGSAPGFRRISSAGAGPYTTVVDAYDVRCGGTLQTVYLDMYRPNYT